MAVVGAAVLQGVCSMGVDGVDVIQRRPRIDYFFSRGPVEVSSSGAADAAVLVWCVRSRAQASAGLNSLRLTRLVLKTQPRRVSTSRLYG